MKIEENTLNIQARSQEQFVSLMISNKKHALDWAQKGPASSYFDQSFKHILHAIRQACNKNVLLTKKGFVEYLRSHTKDVMQRAANESIYDRVSMVFADQNDFNTLRKQITNAHVSRLTLQAIKKWHEKQKSGKDAVISLKALQSQIVSLSSDSQEQKKTVYESVSSYADIAFQDIKKSKQNEQSQSAQIQTGIKELDDAMVVGLAPGTMTLFCADVGHFKTSIMTNIGMNVWKKGHNTLFIPIEMPRKLLYYKFLSRMAQVPFDHILKPKKFMTQQQFDKIKKATKQIKQHIQSQFYIMQRPDFTSVASIKRQIDRNVQTFNPKLVVADYIGILTPDDDMKNQRDDQRIGLMIKRLRSLGKPGSMTNQGFGIVSGAQIGRDALKRIRKLGTSKIQFHSQDLRGSHNYSADSDNIFAQMKDPAQENSRLNMFHIKTRYGKPYFSNGSKMTSLQVRPQISLIRDIDNGWQSGFSDDILSRVDTSVPSHSIVKAQSPAGFSGKDVAKVTQVSDIFDGDDNYDDMSGNIDFGSV